MPFFRSVIDTFTLGSERPIRRLLAYYAILAAIGALVFWLWPASAQLLFDDADQAGSEAPYLLQDGFASTLSSTVAPGIPATLQQLLLTALSLVGAIGLMLPVSWVYMSARNIRGHNQAIVQTLIILPIVVAGIVFVVRNSLALAFSLAGVVAAVRFRTTLRDARDVVFIFLAIAVGFAAGVSMLGAGTLVSIVFNFVVLFTWRYDFGRSMLSPTAASQWRDPLTSLAATNGHTQVPDRELLLALTPTKVSALADRFDRVRAVLGTNKGKPRFNAVLSVTSDHVSEAQALVQRALDQCTRRWVLDEVVTHAGKPSELFYLVRLSRKTSRDEVLTAVRAQAGDRITSADLEVAESVTETEDVA